MTVKKGKAKPRFYFKEECALLENESSCKSGRMMFDGCPNNCQGFVEKEADSDG
jgi:hypothetical protein